MASAESEPLASTPSPRRVTLERLHELARRARRRIDVGDEQAGGVGADVHDGDAHGRMLEVGPVREGPRRGQRRSLAPRAVLC